MAGKALICGTDATAATIVCDILQQEFIQTTHLGNMDRLNAQIAACDPDFCLFVGIDDGGTAVARASAAKSQVAANIPVAAVCDSPGEADFQLARNAGLDDLFDLGAPVPMWQIKLAGLQREQEALRNHLLRHALEPDGFAMPDIWDETETDTEERLKTPPAAPPLGDLSDVVLVPQDGRDMQPFLQHLAYNAAIQGENASIIAVVDDAAHPALGRVIKAGASDIMARGYSGEELAYRAALLTRRRNRHGALRRQLSARLKLAFIDPLTGLENRRGLLRHLNRLLFLHSEQAQAFSVAMLDVDHFKRINDTYGHSVGDDVLREIAARIKSSVRSTDAVGRLGGEEFLVLMPGASLNEAQTIARRILKRVGKGVQTDGGGLPQIPTTISIGLAEIDRPDSPQTVLELVDLALMSAKRRGRNNVQIMCAAA